MPAGLPTPHDKTTWVLYRNDSGETVPPFGVLRITGTEQVHGETIFTGNKPSASAQKWYAVNGPAAVADGRIGECTFTPQCIVRYESGSPSAGDEWGPTNGVWGISSSGTGFVVLGTRTNNRSVSIVDAVQTRSVAAGAIEWASISVEASPGSEQTITSGGGYTAIQFTVDDDNGGDLTGDAANDRIVIASTGYYLHHLSLVVFASTVTAGLDGRIYNGATAGTYFTLFTVPATQNVMTSYSTVFNHSTSNPNIQIQVQATTGDVKITQAHLLMIKGH